MAKKREHRSKNAAEIAKISAEAISSLKLIRELQDYAVRGPRRAELADTLNAAFETLRVKGTILYKIALRVGFGDDLTTPFAACLNTTYITKSMHQQLLACILSVKTNAFQREQHQDERGGPSPREQEILSILSALGKGERLQAKEIHHRLPESSRVNCKVETIIRHDIKNLRKAKLIANHRGRGYYLFAPA